MSLVVCTSVTVVNKKYNNANWSIADKLNIFICYQSFKEKIDTRIYRY